MSAPLNYLDENQDYELAPGHTSVWVGAGPWSIYIKKTDEGLAVDVYPRNKEASDSVAGTWVLDTEAEQDKEVSDG